MLIPPDWDGQSFCRYAVCWPDSPLWKIILRGLVSEPARGFFWDERTGTVTEVLAGFRQTLDENLHLPEVIMACGDTGLQEGLQAIAQAIITASATASASANATANGCCEQTIIDQNGGVAGSTTQPATGETIPIFGTQPPQSVPPGEYPEGYASLPEYDLDKCQVANLVVTGAVGSFRGLGALGVFNYIALAGLIVLAITGAIIFPPALIPMAAAALGFLALEVTTLTLVANEIEANRDEWVCWLYESDSVETALSLIADGLDAIITGLGLVGKVGWAVKTIGLLIFNADTLNQLYTKVAHLTYPDADCSACVACPEIFSVFPDAEGEHQELPYTALSYHYPEQPAAPYVSFWQIATSGSSILIKNITGHSPSTYWENDFVIIDWSGNRSYDSDAVPDEETVHENVKFIYFVSNSSFSFDVECVT